MKYPFKKIVSVLALYRDNDNALTRTAKEAGVSCQSIRTWKLNFGAIIYGLLDNAGDDQTQVCEEDFNRIRLHKPNPEPKTEMTHAIPEAEMEEGTYQALITQTKLDAVKKLRDRIKTGTSKTVSVKEITDALKLLHEIDSTNGPGGVGEMTITEEYAQLLVLTHKKKVTTVKQLN